jgi:hypothetical protein
VAERCTCGAVLPPDALFCHKCGKPQREDLIPVETEPAPTTAADLQASTTPPPPALPTSAPEPPPIGFHNGPAVRIALLAGVLSIVVSALTGQLPLLRVLAPVWLVATGFLAVFLYRRRTGQRLSALSGAHLGWICGIFGFVIVTIILTIFAVALSEPTFVSAMQEQLRDHGTPESDVAQVKQVIEALRTPAGIASALLTSFVLFTLLPAFGGLLGAKLLDRD